MGLPMTPSPIKPMFSGTMRVLSRSGSSRTLPPLRSYNPNARLHMKRAIIAAALIGVAASPLLAGGKNTVTGEDVEARTAEVFTGGCIMNSEAETMGKQAGLPLEGGRRNLNRNRLHRPFVLPAPSGETQP